MPGVSDVQDMGVGSGVGVAGPRMARALSKLPMAKDIVSCWLYILTTASFTAVLHAVS